jgi:hypothetical protein
VQKERQKYKVTKRKGNGLQFFQKITDSFFFFFFSCIPVNLHQTAILNPSFHIAFKAKAEEVATK